MPNALDLRQITKRFGNTLTLDDISLQLPQGEVLALLGDNGAGKSTLIKIISGLVRPDAGQMRIHDTPVDFSRYSVKHSRKLGIETVYQESCVGTKQFLWRNVFMGRHLTNRFGFIDIKKEKMHTRRILQDHLGLHGVGLDENALVKTLSGGEKQGLAIARALFFKSSILILDEPTTALSVKEVKKVMEFIGGIKAQGKSGILITHNIGHAWQAADRFLLLERGRVAGSHMRKDLSLKDLTDRLVEIAS